VKIIDPQISLIAQPELMSGENLLWTGKPNPSVIFHSDDKIIIPFSLLVGGFAIFWELGVFGFWGAGPVTAERQPQGAEYSIFKALWGVLFILIGQYLIWGRFLSDAWLKRRTYYAITNRRVLVIQEGWRRKTSWLSINTIPTVKREGSRRGTIWFGKKLPLLSLSASGHKVRNMSRFYIDDTPVFADIDDLDYVYRMVSDLREKNFHIQEGSL